jgi:hypothetical protein
MGGRRLVILVGVAVALGVAEREAEACICSPSSTLVAPASDEHPVGAPLAFQSWCGSGLDAWSVTVDGEIATLVADGEGPEIETVSVEPAPPEGAEVILFESCERELGVAEGCAVDQEVVARADFVIGPADAEPPPGVAAIVVEHESGEFEGECGGPSLPSVRVHAEVTLAERERGTWAEITFLRDDELIGFETRELPQTAALQSSLLVDEDDYAGHEVCVEVVVRDAAGNESVAQRDCTAIAEASGACTFASDARSAGLAPLLVLLVARRRRRG